MLARGRPAVVAFHGLEPMYHAQLREESEQSGGLSWRYRMLQERLMPLHDAMFVEPSPAPVKYAGSLLGLCTDEVRLPLMAATDAARAKVKAAMDAVGISK